MTINREQEVATARRARHPARLAGFIAIFAGGINLLSAAIPGEAVRLQHLESYVPGVVSHTAVPITAAVGIAMIFLAGGLRRRSRAAWALMVGLLISSSLAHVLKGLDVEEALLDAFLAGLLAGKGEHFGASTGSQGSKHRLFDFVIVICATFAFGLIGLTAATNGLGPIQLINETARMAAGLDTSVPLGRHMKEVLPWSVASIFWVGLLIAVVRILAPSEKRNYSPATTTEALDSVDSLSWFATRADKYSVRSNGAVITYGVKGVVALASGDPLGPSQGWFSATNAFLHQVASEGRVAAVIGCSQAAVEIYKRHDLRPIYMGDEAVLNLNSFTLDGKAMKTVRNSWTRAQRAGYTSITSRVGNLEPDMVASLRSLSDKWRGNQTERGFSMSLGRLFEAEDKEAFVVIGLDDSGIARGFLHLVPWGHDGASLDVMRRDREAIGVLNDFLVAEAARQLPTLGIGRISLNFSALRGVLVAGAEPSASRLLRMQRWALLKLSKSFQIETLYRFNKKFNPQWVPRYLMVEAPEDTPRILWAALRLEGLINLPGI